MKKQSTEVAIIKALKKHDGYLSGEELASESSISRAAIWKHINNLRGKGYEIEAVSRLGYRLVSSPDILIPEELIPILKTKYIGKRIVHETVVDSTNNVAKVLAEDGEKEGTVVVAEKQSRGKGRLNRSWSSPMGGIWLSVILRPNILPAEASRFPILAAVTTAKTIETLGIKPEIKWPNDILIKGKKVSGILLELTAQADKIDYLIIGFGINANFSLSRIPQDSRKHATTLSEALGRKINRREFVASLLFELEQGYNRLLDGDWKGIQKDWISRCTMLHKNISLSMLYGAVEGEFVGIDDYGSIRIKLPKGGIKSFAAGDVTVKKRLT
ncbi:MAG: biotin--[acetyl-CoA-carboxylase] ligase [Firmicutes bacterium]|nr:biotin--[acetyl-CoA-carboxylase] ligase [Bacillota bacterium]